MTSFNSLLGSSVLLSFSVTGCSSLQSLPTLISVTSIGFGAFEGNDFVMNSIKILLIMG